MEYCDYGPLMSWNEGEKRYIRNERIYNRVKELLDESPQLTSGYSETEEVARWLFRQVVEGLNYLHETMKIAHRDIKPENIMYVTAKGSGLLPDECPDDKEADKIKIGDFTVALELTREEVRVND